MRGADYENLIMFTSSLATLHRAGIPLLRALSIIKIGGNTSRFNYVIDQLRTAIQSGRMLSEAMEQFPDVFSNVYVSCIRAGEESGQLEHTLDELATMLEREMELTRHIKSGLRYPLIVVTAIVGAFFVLINSVVPKFAGFYGSFDAELPMPTRIILAVSDFCTSYWPLMLLLLAAVVVGLKTLVRHEQGRLWFDSQLLRLPVFGSLIIRGNVARFALMFRLMIAAGLPIVRSVSILAGAVKNTAIGQEIRLLADLLRQGREMDVISGEFRYFPLQALHMLGIGLESGISKSLAQGQWATTTPNRSSILASTDLDYRADMTLVLGAFVADFWPWQSSCRCGT
jgi:type II secretory pathway component PulF